MNREGGGDMVRETNDGGVIRAGNVREDGQKDKGRIAENEINGR